MNCCDPAELEVITLGEVTIRIVNGNIKSLTDFRLNLEGTNLNGNSTRRGLNSMIGSPFPDSTDGTKRVTVYLIINRDNIISEKIISCGDEGDPAYERIKCSWDEKNRMQLGEGYDTPVYDFREQRIMKECNGDWCIENIVGDILQVGSFIGSLFFPPLIPLGYQEWKNWLDELEKVRSKTNDNMIGRNLLIPPLNKPALTRFLKTALNQEDKKPDNSLPKEMLPDTAFAIINTIHTKTDSHEDSILESLQSMPELKKVKITLENFNTLLSDWAVEKPDSMFLLDAQFIFSELLNMKIAAGCGVKRDDAWIMTSRFFIDNVNMWPSKKG